MKKNCSELLVPYTKNLNYLKDNDLLVIHCDNFTNFDISKLIEVNKNET